MRQRRFAFPNRRKALRFSTLRFSETLMVRDIYAYRQVAVESFLDRDGVVRIRPMPGQAYSPALAVEFGRKVLYSTERPSFLELETHVKQKK